MFWRLLLLGLVLGFVACQEEEDTEEPTTHEEGPELVPTISPRISTHHPITGSPFTLSPFTLSPTATFNPTSSSPTASYTPTSSPIEGPDRCFQPNASRTGEPLQSEYTNCVFLADSMYCPPRAFGRMLKFNTTSLSVSYIGNTIYNTEYHVCVAVETVGRIYCVPVTEGSDSFYPMMVDVTTGYFQYLSNNAGEMGGRAFSTTAGKPCHVFRGEIVYCAPDYAKQVLKINTTVQYGVTEWVGPEITKTGYKWKSCGVVGSRMFCVPGLGGHDRILILDMATEAVREIVTAANDLMNHQKLIRAGTALYALPWNTRKGPVKIDTLTETAVLLTNCTGNGLASPQRNNSCFTGTRSDAGRYVAAFKVGSKIFAMGNVDQRVMVINTENDTVAFVDINNRGFLACINIQRKIVCAPGDAELNRNGAMWFDTDTGSTGQISINNEIMPEGEPDYSHCSQGESSIFCSPTNYGGDTIVPKILEIDPFCEGTRSPTTTLNPTLSPTLSPTGPTRYPTPFPTPAQGLFCQEGQGFLRSGNVYTSVYLNNIRCRFRINGTLLRFPKFDVRDGDYLYIKEGSDVSFYENGAGTYNFTESNPPPSVLFSSSGFFSVFWSTDEANFGAGWELTTLNFSQCTSGQIILNELYERGGNGALRLMNLTCGDCPAGKFQPSPNPDNSSACSLCPAGSKAAVRSAACTLCVGDSYSTAGSGSCTSCSGTNQIPNSDFTGCEKCPELSYTFGDSNACCPIFSQVQKNIVAAANATTSSSSSTLRNISRRDTCVCDTGYFYYRVDVDKYSNPTECVQCPANGVCVKLDKNGEECFQSCGSQYERGVPDSLVAPKSGYWVDQFSERLDFIKCPNENACEGKRGQCAKGYEGLLCTVCEDGYGRSGRSECPKCKDKAHSIAAFVALWVLVFVAGIGLAFLNLLSAKDSVKDPHALCNFSVAVILVKIAMNTAQFNAIAATFDYDWPKPVKAVLSAESILGAQMVEYVSTSCLRNGWISWVYIDTMFWASMPPGFLLLAFVTVVLFERLSGHAMGIVNYRSKHRRHRRKSQTLMAAGNKETKFEEAKWARQQAHRDSDNPLNQQKLRERVGTPLFRGKKRVTPKGSRTPSHKYISLTPRTRVKTWRYAWFWAAYMSLFLYVYPALVRQTFIVFQCYSVGSSKDLYLQIQMTEKCFHGDHLTYGLGIGIPMMIMYVIGFPLVSLWLLVQNRDNMWIRWKKESNIDKTQKDARMIKSLPLFVLFFGYKESYFWYEILILLRKVSILVVASFLVSPITKAAMSILLVVIMLILQVKCMPWNSDFCNIAEILGLTTSFMTYFVGQFLYFDAYENYRTMVSATIVAVNIAFFLWMGCSILYKVTHVTIEKQINRIKNRFSMEKITEEAGGLEETKAAARKGDVPQLPPGHGKEDLVIEMAAAAAKSCYVPPRIETVTSVASVAEESDAKDTECEGSHPSSATSMVQDLKNVSFSNVPLWKRSSQQTLQALEIHASYSRKKNMTDELVMNDGNGCENDQAKRDRRAVRKAQKKAINERVAALRIEAAGISQNKNPKTATDLTLTRVMGLQQERPKLRMHVAMKHFQMNYEDLG